MALKSFVATAVTCEIIPGTQQVDAEGMVQVEGQLFLDQVESAEVAIAGTNRPLLNLKFSQQSGAGELQGHFTLTPKAVAGTWEGEIEGQMIGGMVRASGLARGTGALEGAVLHIQFQQVATYPGKLPCEEPKAFFAMSGEILT